MSQRDRIVNQAKGALLSRRSLLLERERLAEREQLELQEIERALRRLARGRWGVCLRCGHAIGTQLLRTFPERRYCLSCGPTNGA